MKSFNFTFSRFNFSLTRNEVELNQQSDTNTMNRKKAYWLSQVSGWALYALTNIIIISLFKEFQVNKAFSIILLSLSGIILTHLYRQVIKKHSWFNLPLKKIIPRIVVSAFVQGVLLFLATFLFNYVAGLVKSEEYNLGIILLNIVNMSSIILVWSLIYFSIHYFENYKKVEIEALIWEAAVKDYELKTLKSQLNPHFMFNALNSIRALIEEDPKSAQTAVTKLSNILRYSLKIDSTETVALQDEMQTVADYLALETIRFEERLKYNINIDPKSGNIEIPPMMIQTLVENGIKHGISKRTSGGNICVTTKVNDAKLYVQITNTGHIDEKAVMNSKGFGLNNTRHRLNLLYGEKGLFSIKNNSEDEVLTELVIPTGGINK